MRRAFVGLASVLMIAALACPVRAEPGRLDRFFSKDGKQTAFTHGATGYAVAIDKHGRVVVAGYTLGNHTDIALARFLPNGKPDERFGNRGRVVTDLGGTDYAFDLALQKNGKIVVVGERDRRTSSRFAVVRYGTAGKRDRTFSGDGIVLGTFGKTYQGANAVAIGASGNITVGGFTSNGTGSRWAIARYRPGGKLDKRFGHGGKVTSDLSPTDEQVEDLRIGQGGRIIAVGYAESFLIPRFAIARYLPGGKLDKSFAHGGVNLVDVSKGGDTGYGMAIQPDGRILMVGFADHGGRGDWGIVRFGTQGRLDHTFSGDGIEITAFGPAYEYAYQVAVQDNGKIVAAGRAFRKTGDFCLVRYKPRGGLDGTFGGDGKVCTDFFRGDDAARDVAIQDNGKIVAVGEAQRGHTRRFAVARFLAS